jgi:acyl-CoA synthetase (AMP-forming)/AMP-acid ligase II/thioesterase domain-containing protein/acyl carrier protein
MDSMVAGSSSISERHDKPAASQNKLYFMTQQLCIHHLIEFQAKRIPDAVAIAAPGRKPLTYSRLRAQVEETIQTLNALGLGRHDRIALALPTSPEMAVSFIAVAAGATCAPLNSTYTEREFATYLSDLKAKAIIVEAGTQGPARKAAQSSGVRVVELALLVEAEAGIFTLKGDEALYPSVHGLARPHDIALVLPTSGTTSRPKIVPLTHANVCVAAKFIQVALELTDRDRCLNIMPLHHIHGLMLTLSTLFTGASICTIPFDSSKFFDWMEELHPTWYSAGPTMHRAILDEAPLHRHILSRCPLRFIRSSSAALPPQVLAELDGVFQAPVVEGYGMTESALCVTNNPLPPQRRKPGSVGVAAIGLELAIIDEVGTTMPVGEKGEVAFRGANVTLGYEDNPAANQAAFVNGWFRSGDQGYLDNEGYLYITGRLKELINRGGEKIAPLEVDEVLLCHPAVAEAVTFSIPHTTLGEDVAAAVVIRQNMSVTEREIREFASHRLADFKVPRRVFIVDEIPKGPTGKVQRIGLAETLRVTQPDLWAKHQKADYAAPTNSTEEVLANLWAKLFSLERISKDDDFFRLGGDSLLAARLFAQIDKVLGKRLPLGTLFEAPTVHELAEAVQKGGWSSLVTIQSRGSKLPLLCVHAGRGDILFCRNLARHLGPNQPFYGLQALGLNGNQAIFTRIEEMAAHYVKEIRRVQSHGPYLLAGYSIGGLVAYEMAQHLKKQSQEVALLILLDPTFPCNRKFASDSSASGNALGKIAPLCAEIRRHWRNLSLLRPGEKLTYIADRIIGKTKNSTAAVSDRFKKIACKAYFGIGRPLPFSLRRFYLREVHLRAAQEYVPETYSGQAVIFKAEESSYDPQLEWNKLIRGKLEIHEVPGDHSSFLGEPNVQLLAKQLENCLERIQRH